MDFGVSLGSGPFVSFELISTGIVAISKPEVVGVDIKLGAFQFFDVVI